MKSEPVSSSTLIMPLNRQTATKAPRQA